MGEDAPTMIIVPGPMKVQRIKLPVGYITFDPPFPLKAGQRLEWSLNEGVGRVYPADLSGTSSVAKWAPDEGASAGGEKMRKPETLR